MKRSHFFPFSDCNLDCRQLFCFKLLFTIAFLFFFLLFVFFCIFFGTRYISGRHFTRISINRVHRAEQATQEKGKRCVLGTAECRRMSFSPQWIIWLQITVRLTLPFSPFHLPALKPTTDTCHTRATWEDRWEAKWRNIGGVINWGGLTWESLVYRMVITEQTSGEPQREHADRLQVHQGPVEKVTESHPWCLRGQRHRCKEISVSGTFGKHSFGKFRPSARRSSSVPFSLWCLSYCV